MDRRLARRAAPFDPQPQPVRAVAAWLDPAPPSRGGGGILLAIALSAMAWTGFAALLLG